MRSLASALLVVLVPLTHGFEGAVAPLRQLHDPGTGLTALLHVPTRADGPMPLLLCKPAASNQADHAARRPPPAARRPPPPSGDTSCLSPRADLHGAGESGTDVRGLISEGATGTPPVELEKGTALPILRNQFVMVAPQTSHGWEAVELGKFLDFLLSPASGLQLDPKRLYVTGHSMGGAGALVAATTRRFACAVPVAPAGSVRAAELRGVPVWAFHGKNDVVVPSDYSERLIERLRKNGANESEARLTLYERAPAPVGWPDYDGHASTIPAYATPELWRWMLEQRLGGG